MAGAGSEFRGAVAHWKQRCVKEGGVTYLIIDGWVEDTVTDGRCGYVTAKPYFGAAQRTAKACNSDRTSTGSSATSTAPM